jgi:hypothetical protein
MSADETQDQRLARLVRAGIEKTRRQSDDRSVTDLETTALDAKDTLIEAIWTPDDVDEWEAAVRELARRAQQGAPNDCDIYIARAEAAEADRDRLQAALDRVSNETPDEQTHRWRNEVRRCQHERDAAEAGAQTLRDALERARQHLPMNPGAALSVILMALATPDTPPDAPTEGGDVT